jgi:hypothetical protein
MVPNQNVISHSLSKILLDASYENKWVAIASDYSRVIATAESLRELFRVVSDSTAVFYRVLPRDVSFAPLAAQEDEV